MYGITTLVLACLLLRENLESRVTFVLSLNLVSCLVWDVKRRNNFSINAIVLNNCRMKSFSFYEYVYVSTKFDSFSSHFTVSWVVFAFHFTLKNCVYFLYVHYFNELTKDGLRLKLNNDTRVSLKSRKDLRKIKPSISTEKFIRGEKSNSSGFLPRRNTRRIRNWFVSNSSEFVSF